MESCIAEAKAMGRSGICMLAAQKQKAWLSNQDFAKKFGFVTADTAANGYELLALSFDGTLPRFTERAKAGRIDKDGLVVYYDMQCPFMLQRIEQLVKYCADKDVPAEFIRVDSLKAAKELPCAFNDFGVFYKGEFQTVNLPDASGLERLLKK